MRRGYGTFRPRRSFEGWWRGWRHTAIVARGAAAPLDGLRPSSLRPATCCSSPVLCAPLPSPKSNTAAGARPDHAPPAAGSNFRPPCCSRTSDLVPILPELEVKLGARHVFDKIPARWIGYVGISSMICPSMKMMSGMKRKILPFSCCWKWRRTSD